MVQGTRKQRTSRKHRNGRRRQARRGGGWSQGPPLSAQAYYVPEYKSYTECYDFSRPGAIQSNPNPALAQTQMAGGAGCGMGWGTRRSRRGKSCGTRRGGSRRARTGTCGYYGARGGKRSLRTRKQRGGRFAVDVSQSIGGDGPNVAPLHPSIPCEAHRPMPLNPTSPSQLSMAPSPDVFVSGLRPAFIQSGGAQAYTPHPLAYTAPRAEYTFFPNIAQGTVLSPGQIPYNVVVPVSTTGGVSCGDAMAQINKMA